jgi:hypothetical protein
MEPFGPPAANTREEVSRVDTEGRRAAAASPEEFVDLLAARLDAVPAGTLDGEDPDALAAAVTAELRSAGPWSDPPAQLRDAVMARVLAAAEPVPGSPPAADEVTSLDARRSARAERAGRRPRLVWTVPAAAAAAAVFAAGVLAADRYVADLRLGSETYEAAGTELAPGATADIAITETGSGFAIMLDPRGLPAAAEGSYYAAWLRDADGVTVPIGSFHGREGGSIELWSGVDPADFEAITVTLQSVGTPVLPSGPAVLRAEL